VSLGDETDKPTCKKNMWLKMTRICLKIFNKIKFCSFVSFQITSSGLKYFDPTPIRKKSERANERYK